MILEEDSTQWCPLTQHNEKITALWNVEDGFDCSVDATVIGYYCHKESSCPYCRTVGCLLNMRLDDPKT